MRLSDFLSSISTDLLYINALIGFITALFNELTPAFAIGIIFLIKELILRFQEWKIIMGCSSNERSTWFAYLLQNDEEKLAILLEYRIDWFGNKKLTKCIHIIVFIKTLHHIFIEIKLNKWLDKVKHFKLKIPRR